MNNDNTQRQRDRIIILATDGSLPAMAATKMAVQMAADTQSRIIAVTVNEGSIMTALERVGEEVATSRFKGPMVFGPEVAQRYGETQGVMVETMTLPAGPLVASILKFSEEIQPDLIIMGNSGRSGWERIQLGSVAEGVMKHSRYPVLITKGFQLDDLKDIMAVAKGIVIPAPPEVYKAPPITLDSLNIRHRLSVAVMAMMVFLIPYFGLGLASAFYPGTMVSDILNNLPVNILWMIALFPLGWLTAIAFNRIAESYDRGD
ncbi:MAG: universal stress protein [Candidatus Methanomethylophilaceae archaeon]